MTSAITFLVLFFVLLPLVYFTDSALQTLVGGVIAYTILHIGLLHLCKTPTQYVWWILTFLHGYAHIYYPAFYGMTYNESYTPVPDFVIHAIECLMIYKYHRSALSGLIAVLLFCIVFGSSAWSHYNHEFMGTNWWLFASGCGVVGAFYHMLLLNVTKSNSIYLASAIIWFVPYLGYLDFGYIPTWDSKMNEIGLFRIWFMNYFLTYWFLDTYKQLFQ